MVATRNASVDTWSAAMWTPQHEFWFGGPMTIVNYKGAGALRGCADVSCRVRSPSVLFDHVRHYSVRGSAILNPITGREATLLAGRGLHL